MPLEQTVTIVNNSGKVISTGKQLVSIFKEAKASYNEKKAEIKALKRAETFDHSYTTQRQDDQHHRPRSLARHATYEPRYYTEYDYGRNPDYQDERRRSFDLHSETGSQRSHSSSHAHSHSHSPCQSRHGHHRSRSRPAALTASNLKTLSEISSTVPSQAPSRAPLRKAYRSPYAETLPKDSRISWMNLTRCDTQLTTRPGPDWRQSTLVPRRRSEPEIASHQTRPSRDAGKEIDMHLAYGDIPPDLADRVDLDPAVVDEYHANELVRRIESLLEEAQCVQHSATSMIKHLQEKPEAAASVALTLAELSSVVGKMSPAFLNFLKSGSPAVFSLLASPQFLIGTGIAVGLTVVMFGGWKIVKRVQEQQASRAAAALTWEESSAAHRPALLMSGQGEKQAHGGEGGSGMVEEALVVDDDLSTIETWRRGILPLGADNESAEIELITPVADRAQRDKHGKDDFDVRSHRSTRTTRTDKTSKTAKTSKSAMTALTTKTAKTAKTAMTTKTAKTERSAMTSLTTKTAKTSKSSKTEKSSSSSSSRGKEKEKGKEVPAPDGRISRRATVESVYGADSDLGTYRSSKRDKQDRDRDRDRDRASVKMVDQEHRSNGMELIFRPKGQSQSENMLKALFKTKDRKERESRTELVMAG
ncbi:hypothetical protein E4U54_004742 [Claviceps lovelessii]|nr:hypothetical protein E4U54_004742 [Claviceps lovelessii]